MLNYRLVRLVGIVFLITFLVAGLFDSRFFLFVIITLVIVVALFGWGSYSISSDFYLPVICKASENGRELAITFDDGPNKSVTPQLLNLLEKYQVKATFFCIGKHIEQNEELLREIAEKGHLIGNHSFSHKNTLPFFSPSNLRKDLIRTEHLIKKITGKKPLLFRPPFGVTSRPYAKVLKELNYYVIGWNIRSLDTVIKDKDKLVSRVKSGIKGGDIILFHDTDLKILDVVEDLLNHIQKNGIKVVPLDSMLNITAYE